MIVVRASKHRPDLMHIVPLTNEDLDAIEISTGYRSALRSDTLRGMIEGDTVDAQIFCNGVKRCVKCGAPIAEPELSGPELCERCGDVA